jgi:AraC-like DNA-binding protein
MLPDSPRLIGKVPEPISFRIENFPAGTIFPSQEAPWGKVLYAVRGLAEFDIAGRPYLSPPAYAIWIPPKVEHRSRIHHDVRYASVYIGSDHCGGMPTAPCTLALNDLIKAAMNHFAERRIVQPRADEDYRLAMVLLDQLRLAPRHDSYLPTSADPTLNVLIAALQANPGDRRPLSEWARFVGTTERTLSRRWREVLGLSFNEWRQRLKLVIALSQLDAGRSVHEIATELGYNNTSAFISMFRKMTGTSPQQMRKGHLSPLPRTATI